MNEIQADLEGVTELVLDLETTGVQPFNGSEIVGIAYLIPSKGVKKYIPFRHLQHNPEWMDLNAQIRRYAKNKKKYAERLTDLGNQIEQVPEWLPVEQNHDLSEIEAFRPFFADPNNKVVGFNIKFDVHFFGVLGMEINCQLEDVMLGAHLANENEVSFKLKDLGEKYLNYDAKVEQKEMLEYAKALGFRKPMENIAKLPLSAVSKYAMKDVQLTHDLRWFYIKRLEQDGILHLYNGPDYNINQFNEAIREMEHNGVPICRETTRTQIANAMVKKKDLEERIRSIAGPDFNPRSVPQLKDVLQTAGTSREHLLKSRHPIAPFVNELRQVEKAVSTYYDAIMELADDNSRIHPSLLVHGTVAGRLSCRGPNLQNIPVFEEGSPYRVRECVIAGEGRVLLSLDFSQIELRMLAQYCEDPMMLTAYREGLDLHQQTADQLGITRQEAKTINFGIVYGMGPDALSKKLRIDYNAAQKILDEMDRNFPLRMGFLRKVIRYGEKHGFIRLWTGRKRRYHNKWECHTAPNNLIQGGAAEVFRYALTRVHRMTKGTDVKPVLAVHDDIILDLPEDQLFDWLPRIKAAMEDFDFKVPIVADAKYGRCWAGMEKVK